MELREATLSWSNSILTSFHISQSVSMCRTKKFTVLCLDNDKKDDGSTESQKENQMVVSITGATGFVGRRLVQRLHADNHRVRVLTRSRSKAQSIFPVRDFPGIVIAEEPEWRDCIQGSNAVVNLAGMPISTRWSSEIKKEIKQSRISITSKVVDIINGSQDDARPAVFVSATAIGYYGSSETQVFDEQSPSGNDYLAEVCREWEARALKVNKEVRLALIRIGVVLGKDGGALAKMIPLFMVFAGGPLGSGKQWFSWIHLDDIVNLIYEALSNPSYKGVINGTAPNPVRLAELCEQLGHIMGRPSWLPVPDFALKAVLGEGASVVLEGQRVLPQRAKELGYSFKYPFVKDALKAILSSKS
ncbi:epimerase family protein SDR39U1 homolog, chloroplastic [Telopea speciosissima]|uniref:epimerase family protein SDR39U1 homolog, chloroplastic n=1 Tax=Telopea speciosissima TaxID=54955 RepID=UPI001CC4605B|nr:epimerase family protein SDR39U1 homolog, chloroplastic [Telopea speciosissima]